MPQETHQDNAKPANAGRNVAPHMFTVGQLGKAMAEAMAYNVHHFNCPQCIAAGRVLNSNQRRCEVGAPLWHDYMRAVVTLVALPDGNHGKNDFSTLSGRV